jgi:hypothetical protein
MLRKVRDRLTYANVMATAAIFIALGGTSFALTLPRNSVGRAQLRAESVGRSELRPNAVSSAQVRNRSIRLKDIRMSAQEALRGQPGPAGPPGPPGVNFFAAVNSGGGLKRGNATFTARAGANGRIIGFSRSIASCVSAATLASVPGGHIETPPGLGHVITTPTADGRILVRTWNANGTEETLPFNLIVAC